MHEQDGERNGGAEASRGAAAPHPFARRTMVVSVVLLAFTVLTARVLIDGTVALFPSREHVLIQRQIDEMNALPSIAQSRRPQVLVLGSSLVYLGFSAEAFDLRARDLGFSVDTYNMGIPPSITRCSS